MIKIKTETQLDYKECYIAFLDIMGFKNLIETKTCDFIFNIFENIEENTLESPVVFHNEVDNRDVVPIESVRKYIMSDSIVMYVETRQKYAFNALLRQCQYMAYKLLTYEHPILLRGAIVQGEIYRKQSIIYGHGLNEAYILQEKSAVYPRIIMKNDIFNSLSDREKSMAESMTRLDMDYFRIISYKNLMNDNMRCKLRKFAEKQLDSLVDSNVRKKYLYIVDRFTEKNYNR